MASKFRLNLYDCNNCETTKVPATFQMCPQCGAPKPPVEEEYPGPYVTDPVSLAAAHKKPFVRCSSCGGANFGEVTVCDHCGNEIEASDQVQKPIDYGANVPRSREEAIARNAKPEPKAVVSSGLTRSPQPSRPARSATNSLPTFRSSPVRVSNTKLYLGIAVLVLIALACVIGIIWASTSTDNYQGRVYQFTWTREYKIQEYQKVRYTDSTTQPPEGAYNITHRDVTTVNTVTRDDNETVEATCTKTVNLGNGYSEEKEVDCSYTVTKTVFDHNESTTTTYWTYDINEWTNIDPATTSGANREPFWPTPTLVQGNPQVEEVGDQKIVGQSEHYFVHFVRYDENEKEFRIPYEVNFTDWMQYQMEFSYPLEINKLGQIKNNPLFTSISLTATAVAE